MLSCHSRLQTAPGSTLLSLRTTVSILRLAPCHKLSITTQRLNSTSTMSSYNSHPQSSTTFQLRIFTPAVPVHLPSHLPTLVTQSALLSFPAFKTWTKTLHQSLSLQHTDSKHPFHSSPYKLRSLTVQSADLFGRPPTQRLGFVKLTAEVTNDAGESLPGAVFLRGGSVAMLLILTPNDHDRKGSENASS